MTDTLEEEARRALVANQLLLLLNVLQMLEEAVDLPDAKTRIASLLHVLTE